MPLSNWFHRTVHGNRTEIHAAETQHAVEAKHTISNVVGRFCVDDVKVSVKA
jgi:hypothetical protein